MLPAPFEDLNGTDKVQSANSFEWDKQYCIDLGLIKQGPLYRPANPIYASLVSKYLSGNVKQHLPEELRGKWMDGKTIDMKNLLKEFQEFWARTAERYYKSVSFIEGAPHALLSAYLVKVMNGGATIQEYYALGLGYLDINIEYKGHNYPIELKIKGNERSRKKSYDQLLRYMDRLLVNEGWLIVVDRDQKKNWKEKISWNTEKLPNGNIIHVLGC
jgi:hypothetical protein